MQHLLYIFSFSILSFFSFFQTDTQENTSVKLSETSVTTVLPPPPCAGGQGRLRMFFWNNVIGSNIEYLYGYPYYPQRPDGMIFTDGLDMPIYFNDYHGALIRGYLLAPQTGSYRFNVTGDNYVNFKLSTNDNPNNATLIASTLSNTGVTEHTKFPEQTSALIPLIAGNYYYFELALKEIAFTDFAKVYWQTPSAMNGTWTLIDAMQLYDYTCETVCNPYGTPCDDGDASTTQDIEDGTCHCSGRPAPSQNACIGERGEWTALYYDNIQGSNIINMDTSANFPNNPSRAEQLRFFQGPSNPRDYYGVWTRAFLSVPVTGQYVFNITGDNETRLWISSGESAVSTNLTQIARVSGTTLLTEHSKYTTQTSSPITLIKGQYYYIELKCKENAGNEHFSVFWKPPFLQDNKWHVISGAFLYKYNCETACMPVNTPCNDDNANTVNDVYDENCNCVGTPCLTENCAGNESYAAYEVCNLTDKHSNVVDAWQSCTTTANPNPLRGTGHWIQYDLGDMYQIHDTHIWNYNKTNETGKGLKDVVIDFSLNGTSWTQMGNPQTWPQASGTTDYKGFVGTDYEGHAARYVLITALNNWNNGNCSGFSELKMNIQACPGANTPCDDGNVHTLNDAYDEFCVCKGVSDGTLALDLLSFTANWDKQNVLIEWQVQNEEAGTYYEVQRSLDAQNFESIGLLSGKAVNQRKTAYQLVDTKGYQLANELFYRLKMIENAERERFSHVVNLRQTDGANRLEINTLQPNPFSESVQITFTIPQDQTKVQLRVFNGRGQFVRDLVNEQVNQGQFQITWDGTDASGKSVEAGIYYVQLTDGKQRIGRRVVRF